MDPTEPNPLPTPQHDFDSSQPTIITKPDSKLIRSLKNVSPFTYFFAAVLAISLITLAYFALQNLSLKSQLGMISFKWPWTSATCTYQGTTFKPGETVPSVDGCNSCSCSQDGQVMCTLMACDSISPNNPSFSEELPYFNSSETNTFNNAPEIDTENWQKHKLDTMFIKLPLGFTTHYVSKNELSPFTGNLIFIDNQSKNTYLECMNKAEIQHEEFKRTGKEPSDGWVNYEGACGLYATMYLFNSELDQAEYQKSKTEYGRMSDIITVFTDKASRNWHVFNSGGRLSLENVALSENTDGSGSMITLGYYDDPKNTFTIVENKQNGEKNLIYSFTKTILSTLELVDSKPGYHSSETTSTQSIKIPIVNTSDWRQ